MFNYFLFVDKLVAIILTEAEERKSSFSLRDLASSLNVRHESRIQDAIDTLCSLGLLSAVGDKWILADYLDSTIGIKRNILNMLKRFLISRGVTYCEFAVYIFFQFFFLIYFF